MISFINKMADWGGLRDDGIPLEAYVSMLWFDQSFHPAMAKVVARLREWVDIQKNPSLPGLEEFAPTRPVDDALGLAKVKLMEAVRLDKAGKGKLRELPGGDRVMVPRSLVTRLAVKFPWLLAGDVPDMDPGGFFTKVGEWLPRGGIVECRLPSHPTSSFLHAQLGNGKVYLIRDGLFLLLFQGAPAVVEANNLGEGSVAFEIIRQPWENPLRAKMYASTLPKGGSAHA